ncbi:MAG: hypothetical protein V3W51_01125, partial [Candidatus Brocadiales bacterium]
MSRILNQLKNARKDGKTPPPNYDATSLDTIIEHNTPGRPKGSNLKRLIIILSIGIGLALIAAFVASYLITHKKRSTHSRLSSAVKEAEEPGPEGLIRRASSEAGWQGLASKELAAKKAETLLVEILSIEGIDEGPIIEDIELEAAPSKEPEEPPAAPLEIETVELVPASAVPLEIEIIELAPPPVEKPGEVPPTPALPKVVKPEKPEVPRIEIKVEEPEVPERPEAVTVEVPPTVVIEPPPVGAEVPPAPVSPAVL